MATQNKKIIKSVRKDLHAFITDIVESNYALDRSVEDVSINGFMINRIPQISPEEPEKYIISASGYQENVKIIVISRWLNEFRNDELQKIDMNIQAPPWTWFGFSQNELPRQESDLTWS